MAHFIPTKESMEAPQVAELFIHNIFRLHGLPKLIVSYRDPRFIGNFWKHVFNKLQVQLNMSSGEHPLIDGQTERVNQILEDMLQAYVLEKQTDWDSFLPLVEFAYNSWKQRTTKQAPFEVIHGFISHNPTTIGLPKKSPTNLKIAQFNLEQALERMKAFVDRLIHHERFKRKPKLSPRFCGPWIVIKKISDVAYKLQLPANCEVHPIFHVSKLRPYISRDENCVDGLVALENRESQLDVPSQVLDRRERKLENLSIPEYLVAWTSSPLTVATWESKALIRKHFPSLITEDSDL
ncbi:hypothetical protein KP509_32G002100 [Ceratopteris richardii]|uniref:Integrase catalytic domain-containing protein n=1 Tax=Ceratopteris richardii TaxID=49495 RepID=A0A8T2QSK5_CERRI|nr:hypothetical protein KP509_32G002100 [Ceratopteris richardii]